MNLVLGIQSWNMVSEFKGASPEQLCVQIEVALVNIFILTTFKVNYLNYKLLQTTF